MKYELFADDGGQVYFGGVVWVNHSAGNGPRMATLVGVQQLQSDEYWPWLVRWETPGSRTGKSTYRWARVYSSREEAVKADPSPEIERLRRRIEELESMVLGCVAEEMPSS